LMRRTHLVRDMTEPLGKWVTRCGIKQWNGHKKWHLSPRYYTDDVGAVTCHNCIRKITYDFQRSRSGQGVYQMSKKKTAAADWVAPRYQGLPSHYDFRDATRAAYEMGAAYSGYDRDQLVQSAEYANDVLPEVRSMAGFTDTGPGTYRELPEVGGMTDDQVEEELEATAEELLDTFWDGFDSAAPASPLPMAPVDVPPPKPVA